MKKFILLLTLSFFAFSSFVYADFNFSSNLETIISDRVEPEVINQFKQNEGNWSNQTFIIFFFKALRKCVKTTPVDHIKKELIAEIEQSHEALVAYADELFYSLILPEMVSAAQFVPAAAALPSAKKRLFRDQDSF